MAISPEKIHSLKTSNSVYIASCDERSFVSVISLAMVCSGKLHHLNES